MGRRHKAGDDERGCWLPSYQAAVAVVVRHRRGDGGDADHRLAVACRPAARPESPEVLAAQPVWAAAQLVWPSVQT